MQTAAIIVWIYGALVLAGGVMGWVRAKSKPSLIAGINAFVLLAIGGYGLWFGMTFGYWMSFGVALGLTAVMSFRFLRSRKFMPAGMTALLSVAVVIALLALR